MAIRAERLKCQEISGEAESRGNAWLEKLKEYPQRMREYLHEVRIEMHQVTWPSRSEVVSTTVVVIVAVAVFSAFLYSVDSGVGFALTWVLNHFRR